ncbi:zinc-binding protein A33-like [Rhinophrynus dorsalis]
MCWRKPRNPVQSDPYRCNTVTTTRLRPAQTAGTASLAPGSREMRVIRSGSRDAQRDAILPNTSQEEWVDRKRLVPLQEAEMTVVGGSKVIELEAPRSKRKRVSEDQEQETFKILEPIHSTLRWNLPEQLMCPICLEAFSDPILLDCGHNICWSCLSSEMIHQSSPSCPCCLKLLHGQKFVPNLALGSLAHQLSQGLRAERIARPKEEREGDQVKTDQFCPTEKPMGFCSRTRECRVTVSSLERHLDSQFLVLQQFLQERKEKLREELKQEANDAYQEMEQELHLMKEECRTIEESLGRAHWKMTKANPASFLTRIKLLTDRYRELVPNMDLSKQNLLDLENQLFGRFRGPVQYAAWKDLRTALKPALSCPLLDPDSSHPNLLLSEGHRRVTYSPVSRSCSFSPTRFNQYLVALGIPRYISGKHYWELEIGENTECDFGVSSESISCRDPFTLTPADGCWICSFRGGHQFVAFDSVPRLFMQQEKPQRVGVYLDYEGGQISFYNAQSMSHLYTFRDAFRGSLRAYVSPCGVIRSERAEQLLRVFRDQL